MAEIKPVRADLIDGHYPGTGTAGERAAARRQSGRLSAAENPPPGDLLGFGVFHPSKKKPFTSLCEAENRCCGQHGDMSIAKCW